MWPFHQPNEKVEAVNVMAHLKTDHLARVEILYREAEQKFQEASLALVRHRNNHREGQVVALAGRVLLPLNVHQNLEASRLEHERWMAKTKRDELLEERAELRKSLGLTR